MSRSVAEDPQGRDVVCYDSTDGVLIERHVTDRTPKYVTFYFVMGGKPVAATLTRMAVKNWTREIKNVQGRKDYKETPATQVTRD